MNLDLVHEPGSETLLGGAGAVHRDDLPSCNGARLMRRAVDAVGDESEDRGRTNGLAFRWLVG